MPATEAQLRARIAALERERDVAIMAKGEWVRKCGAMEHECARLERELAEAKAEASAYLEARWVEVARHDSTRTQLGIAVSQCDTAIAERDRLRTALEAVEWSRPKQEGMRECPCCHKMRYLNDPPIHHKGCQLAEALATPDNPST